jgi:nitrite reductase/ring-hydroxylating ferredoxin subunit
MSARVFETPAGVRLGPLEIVSDGAARNFVLDIRGQYFHGFVVRRGTEVFGYVDQCPHMNVPLSQKLDDYLTPRGDMIACSWHGALFKIEDGLCVGGPCAGASLRPWPVSVVDGSIVTI